MERGLLIGLIVGGLGIIAVFLLMIFFGFGGGDDVAVGEGIDKVVLDGDLGEVSIELEETDLGGVSGVRFIFKDRQGNEYSVLKVNSGGIYTVTSEEIGLDLGEVSEISVVFEYLDGSGSGSSSGGGSSGGGSSGGGGGGMDSFSSLAAEEDCSELDSLQVDELSEFCRILINAKEGNSAYCSVLTSSNQYVGGRITMNAKDYCWFKLVDFSGDTTHCNNIMAMYPRTACLLL